MNNEKRIDDALKLLVSVGEIDDKLIEEARRPHPIFFTIKRTFALVASLIVVTVISIALITLAPAFAPAGGADSSPGAGEESNNSGAGQLIGAGSTVAYGDTNITLITNNDARYSFLLNVADGTPEIDVYVYGYIQNTDGTLIHVVATTSDSAPAGYTKLTAPAMTVSQNGTTETEISAIPNTAGSYMLNIDLSAVKANGLIITSIEFTPFGAAFNPN